MWKDLLRFLGFQRDEGGPEEESPDDVANGVRDIPEPEAEPNPFSEEQPSLPPDLPEAEILEEPEPPGEIGLEHPEPSQLGEQIEPEMPEDVRRRMRHHWRKALPYRARRRIWKGLESQPAPPAEFPIEEPEEAPVAAQPGVAAEAPPGVAPGPEATQQPPRGQEMDFEQLVSICQEIRRDLADIQELLADQSDDRYPSRYG